MPTFLDHLLFVVLALLFPIRAATLGYRRLLRAGLRELPRVRRSVYRQAMLVQWGLTAALAALWIATRRPWEGLGVVPRPTGGLAGVGVGVALVILVMLRQRRLAPPDEETRARLRERMRHLERMLPASREELRLFNGLALTAGFCEEILYRGYLIWYLAHWFDFFPAAVLSSAIFGIGHAYQGARGVVTTTLVGAFLAAVYWVTGSLVAPMAIHALMDLHAGYVAWLAYGRRETAAEALEEPVDEGPAT